MQADRTAPPKRDTRPFCDQPNVNGGECSRRAVVVVTAGLNVGEHFCTYHAKYYGAFNKQHDRIEKN